jgi:beta-glucosidase
MARKTHRALTRTSIAVGVGILAMGVAVTADGADTAAPAISARTKAVLTTDGKQFKDLNRNGKVDPYEDWRLPVAQRADDLVSKMSLEEKAGVLSRQLPPDRQPCRV